MRLSSIRPLSLDVFVVVSLVPPRASFGCYCYLVYSLFVGVVMATNCFAVAVVRRTLPPTTAAGYERQDYTNKEQGGQRKVSYHINVLLRSSRVESVRTTPINNQQTCIYYIIASNRRIAAYY